MVFLRNAGRRAGFIDEPGERGAEGEVFDLTESVEAARAVDEDQ